MSSFKKAVEYSKTQNSLLNNDFSDGTRLNGGYDLLSNNVTMENSSLWPETVSALALEEGFELIPEGVPEYTESKRKNVQVWYGPTADEKNFYYLAYNGSALFTTFSTSSVLCAINKRTMERLYSINLKNYNLTTEANYQGSTAYMPRVSISILEDTLYLCNAIPNNLGPQLCAVNKQNGEFKWALPYYPSLPESLNTRLGDMCTMAFKKNGKKYILAGSSSLQNAFNLAVVKQAPEIPYPVYTDQGFLFCIEDLGTSGKLLWKAGTCVQNLKEGDTIIKGGTPVFDPFRPGKDTVIVSTYTNNKIVNPHVFTGEQGIFGVPVLQEFYLNKNSTPANLVSLWSQVIGKVITVAKNSTSGGTEDKKYTYLELVALLKSLKPTGPDNILFTIYSVLSGENIQNIKNTSLTSPQVAFYFKDLTSGTVLNKYDAQALNYFGNGIWGAPPCVDLETNSVYFGTGQGHSIPFDEYILAMDPSLNFREFIKPFATESNNFVKNFTTLDRVNLSRQEFEENNRLNSVRRFRSPRGQMSYSDSIMAVDLTTGKIKYAVRTIPMDTYTFLGRGTAPANPLLFFFELNIIDGDVSSGVFKHEGERIKLASSTKAGIACILDITDYNPNVKFNHMNLEETGVFYSKTLYLGPTTVLGGANYQCSKLQNGIQVSLQYNNYINFTGNILDSNGNIMTFVSQTGMIVNNTKAFVTGYSIETETVLWVTPLITFSGSSLSAANNVVFTADNAGVLYGIDGLTGQIKWIYNAASGNNAKMIQGSASVAVLDGKLYWINSYNTPFAPVIAKDKQFGNVFSLDDSIYAPSASFTTKGVTTFGVAKKLLVDNLYKSWEETNLTKHSWYISKDCKVHLEFKTGDIVKDFTLINEPYVNNMFNFEDTDMTLTLVNGNTYKINNFGMSNLLLFNYFSKVQ